MKNLFIALAALVAVGCSKSPAEKNTILLSETSCVMHRGEEYQIQARSNTPITYSSENEYHAEVSTEGLVTAGYAGETDIILRNEDDEKNMKITIQSIYHAYLEPDLTIGMSRSDVKAKHGEPSMETSDGVRYNSYLGSRDYFYAHSTACSPYLVCLFDDSDELMCYAFILLLGYGSYVNLFLGERYPTADLNIDNYSLLYVNERNNDISLYMGTKPYYLDERLNDIPENWNWMVLYFPTNKTIDHLGIMAHIDELMQEVKDGNGLYS